MMGYGWGMGGGGWIAMIVFWVALLALIVWAVARAFPSVGNRGGDIPRQESPEDVLNRRYAAGELDTETYQVMRAALAPGRRGGEAR